VKGCFHIAAIVGTGEYITESTFITIMDWPIQIAFPIPEVEWNLAESIRVCASADIYSNWV